MWLKMKRRNYGKCSAAICGTKSPMKLGCLCKSTGIFHQKRVTRAVTAPTRADQNSRRSEKAQLLCSDASSGEKKKQIKTTESAAILSTHQAGAINRLVRYTAAKAPPTTPLPPSSPGSSLHVFHPRRYCTPFVQSSASRASTRSWISL